MFMSSLTPVHITTGVQQIVMRLMGVMVEKQLLADSDVKRIFLEASMTLRQNPSEINDGAAQFVDLLTVQLNKK